MGADGEHAYHAEALGISFRMVPCSLMVSGDRHLLEQMLRNLLSNALKYTKKGGILLGCRRKANTLSIEVCDTGIGIPESQFEKIFEEYQQIGNVARERSRGLGLGLSIVRRLGELLGYSVRVRSKVGSGSVFSVEVPFRAEVSVEAAPVKVAGGKGNPARREKRRGTILLVEDDPEVRELLEIVLEGEGHRVVSAPDGVFAAGLLDRDAVRPDLVLADYNLPNGMNGLQLVAKVREKFHRRVPVIILSGDISSGAIHEIALQSCVHLGKPVKAGELVELIQRQLPDSPFLTAVLPPETEAHGDVQRAVVHVVDDDEGVRESLRSVLETEGRDVKIYARAEAFLAAYRPGGQGCLLVDAYLPGISGIELLRKVGAGESALPAIMITGSSDVPMAVEAMKAGAIDFIEKPIGTADLLASVERALDRSKDSRQLSAWQASAARLISGLSQRQHQIMDMVLAGRRARTSPPIWVSASARSRITGRQS